MAFRQGTSLPFHRQSDWRLDSPRIHSRRSRAAFAKRWKQAFSLATRWWIRRGSRRRQLPRRGQLGNGVQNRRLDGFQGRLQAKRIRYLLEPIMQVEVVVPEEYMGPVFGDLNSRRGQLQGRRIARRHANDPCAKFRWRRCSVTPRNCAAARRGAEVSRCIFHITQQAPGSVSEASDCQEQRGQAQEIIRIR